MESKRKVLVGASTASLTPGMLRPECKPGPLALKAVLLDAPLPKAQFALSSRLKNPFFGFSGVTPLYSDALVAPADARAGQHAGRQPNLWQLD